MSFKVIWEHLKGFATPLDDIKRERKKERGNIGKERLQ
jgi:hypothetical protein